MANPIQQGLKPPLCRGTSWPRAAAMANPIQQGLKRRELRRDRKEYLAAMANPIQQGLKPTHEDARRRWPEPQWLIQYNKD